jgi:uncharacterized protein
MPYAYSAFRSARGLLSAHIAQYRMSEGGEPRQRVFPRDQIEDYRSALTWLSLQPQIDAERLGIWGTSFGGGTVLHVAAYDPRVKAVVSQVGAMDLYQITRAAMGAEQFAALEQLTVKERVRHATEGGEVYIPDAGLPGQGFALQTDQESYELGQYEHSCYQAQSRGFLGGLMVKLPRLWCSRWCHSGPARRSVHGGSPRSGPRRAAC